jgi:hypothetical protein
VRAGRDVIGMCRSSCIASFKGVVVEHETINGRKKRRKSKKGREDGRSNAEVRVCIDEELIPVLNVSSHDERLENRAQY